MTGIFAGHPENLGEAITADFQKMLAEARQDGYEDSELPSTGSGGLMWLQRKLPEATIILDCVLLGLYFSDPAGEAAAATTGRNHRGLHNLARLAAQNPSRRMRSVLLTIAHLEDLALRGGGEFRGMAELAGTSRN